MKKNAKVTVITFCRPIKKSGSAWQLKNSFFHTFEHFNQLATTFLLNDTQRIIAKDNVKITFRENDFNLTCCFLKAATIDKSLVKVVLNTEAIILDFRSYPNTQDDIRRVEKTILSRLKTIRGYSSYSPITILFNPDDDISSTFDEKIHRFKFVTVITEYPVLKNNNQVLTNTDYEPLWQRIAADSFKPSLFLELLQDQVNNNHESKFPSLFHSPLKYPDTFEEALEDRRLTRYFKRNGYLTKALALTPIAQKILQREEIYDEPRTHSLIKNANSVVSKQQ